jgi:hypothetical protein
VATLITMKMSIRAGAANMTIPHDHCWWWYKYNACMPVPPLVTEMQTGTTNNHISQIFFVFAAPMYWRDWLAAQVLMVRYKGDCHVSSTSPNRQVDDYWAGVSGKGNRSIPRWRPSKKRKGHLSPLSETNIYHLPHSRPNFFLIGHFLLANSYAKL